VWHYSVLHYCHCSVWCTEVHRNHSNNVHWRGLLSAVLEVKLLMKSNPYFHGATALSWPGPPHYRDFTITLRHTTLDRTLLDEWAARRRNLYVTTLNTHKRQDIHAPAGFEPAIPAREYPQTLALDRAADGVGAIYIQWIESVCFIMAVVLIWFCCFNDRVWSSSRESLQSRSVMEQSPFWEAGSRSAVQEIPLSLEPSTGILRKPTPSPIRSFWTFIAVFAVAKFPSQDLYFLLTWITDMRLRSLVVFLV